MKKLNKLKIAAIFASLFTLGVVVSTINQWGDNEYPNQNLHMAILGLVPLGATIALIALASKRK